MYWISRYLDLWPWPIFHAPVTYTFYVNVPLSLGCMIRKVSAEDIAIRGNGTGLEYMCPTRHFVYIFFNPVFRLSTAKNKINLFNNNVLIVASVTFAPAGAMTPSAEFLFATKNCWHFSYFSMKASENIYVFNWEIGKMLIWLLLLSRSTCTLLSISFRKLFLVWHFYSEVKLHIFVMILCKTFVITTYAPKALFYSVF